MMIAGYVGRVSGDLIELGVQPADVVAVLLGNIGLPVPLEEFDHPGMMVEQFRQSAGAQSVRPHSTNSGAR